MSESKSVKRRTSARRLALLGSTILSLSAGALLVTPQVFPQSHAAFAQSQNLARPVGFADIVERVKPAVISVRVRMERPQPQVDIPDGDQFQRRFGPDGAPNNMPRGRGYATGQGSGFFISPDGYAVTNNHVVDKATMVQVTTDDGKTYGAKVIGIDQRTDLALIKVEGSNFPYVRLSDRDPRVGDWVIAVGNPFGLGGTVTAGIVSARGRDIGSGPYDDYIQIDAPVNKGNSGGPTFDTDGNVIGVNTAIFSPSGGSVGIAFAIPSSTVKSVVAQLKEKGSVLRGWIGVSVQAVTPEVAQNLGLKSTEGALVTEPQQNGPAARAGIERGDIILAVNGTRVRDSRDLAKRVGNMAPGTVVKLVVLNKGGEKNLSLTLGELPNVQDARAEPQDFGPGGPGGSGPGPGPGMRRRDREPDAQRTPDPRDERGDLRRRFRDNPDMQRDPEREDRGDLRGGRGREGGGFGDQFAQRGGEMPRLGLALTPSDGSEGVTIAAVEPDSRAAQLGFQAGDVILDVGGKTVSSPADVRRALRDARFEGKNAVPVRVKSQQGTRTIDVPLGRA